MIQDQLVDYINAQMKLGVARDAIKSTLVGAGWQAADVEDTLKKVESTTKPATTAPAQPTSAATMGTSSGPQVLKVSDLVSASGPGMSVKPAAASPTAQVKPAMSPMSTTQATTPATTMPARDTSPKSPLTGSPAAAKPASSPVTMNASGKSMSMGEYPPKQHASRTTLFVGIVLVVVVILVGGFAGSLYVQNNSLAAQVKSLGSESSGVASQVSTLQAQLVASTTALAAQVASIGAENQELQSELSFYVAPAGAVVEATSTATIGGVISGGGKTPYVITATYGAKIYVGNSKSASVISALTPLVGVTTAQQLSGTYVPGSDSIMLTTINGTSVQ